MEGKNMKKFIFINEENLPTYSWFTLLLDPSDFCLVEVESKKRMRKVFAMKIVEAVYHPEWDEKDSFITKDGKYFMFIDLSDYELIETMEFSNEDSGRLWFLLEYGGT
jgi:hypothetical protein